MKPKILTSIAMMSVAYLVAAADTHAQSLLQNGDFWQENSQGPYSAHTAGSQASGGQSGAEHWTTWAAPEGTVATLLMPSSFPMDFGNMLGVWTDIGAGVVQVFGPLDGGPEEATACVWLYLEYGSGVCVGIGNGGNTHCSMTLTEKGKWERITVSNGISPANEIVIYADGPGPTLFYVRYAAVVPGPSWLQGECCTPADFVLY